MPPGYAPGHPDPSRFLFEAGVHVGRRIERLAATQPRLSRRSRVVPDDPILRGYTAALGSRMTDVALLLDAKGEDLMLGRTPAVDAVCAALDQLREESYQDALARVQR